MPTIAAPKTVTYTLAIYTNADGKRIIRQLKNSGVVLSFKRAELRNKLKRRSLQVLGELREPEISKMALPSITAGKTKYSFVKPLIVRVKKHESGYYIENNQLGLISSGNTIQMAMRNFSDEFTYIYKRYNELPVEQLTGRVQKIKFLVNSLVHGSSR